MNISTCLLLIQQQGKEFAAMQDAVPPELSKQISAFIDQGNQLSQALIDYFGEQVK